MGDEKLTEPIETKPVEAESASAPKKDKKDVPIHSGNPGDPVTDPTP
jgi:hypothetical protein